ncbi:protocadherin-11 X-linked-like [Tubulanus polymorphus]|uniref:protocadherin-11 X-linked-like n=1 Tax=Tubulanus polymorphus TaxID=672921 RepID=UPI003DA552B0
MEFCQALAIYFLLMNLVHLLLALTDQEILFRLPEETQPDTYVGEVLSASNLKSRFNSSVQNKLRYSFLNPDEPGVSYFRIDEATSVIKTTQTIDRDTLCSIVQTCCPYSNGCYIMLIISIRPRAFFTMINARVDILDINDNRPQFPTTSLTVKMSESTPVNSSIIIPTAIDIDSGSNTVQRYSIISQNGYFGLRVMKSGNEITDLAIVNRKPLDREMYSYHQVKILAIDGGLPRLTGTCTVTIMVTDTNDNVPKFRNTTYSMTVRENIQINSSILQVSATDADDGPNGQIRYTIGYRAPDWIKSTFTVDRMNGWITLVKPLNYEKTKEYRIPIEAKDLGPGAIPVRTTVHLYVKDVNDNSPTIRMNLLTSTGKAEVSESADIGTFVAHVWVQDIDAGSNARVSCAIDNPYFSLIREGPPKDDEYKLFTAAKLNREITREYQVTVICEDQGMPPLESREEFTVNVLDANDNAPQFTQRTYTARVAENNPLGMFLMLVKARDRDDGNRGDVRYEIAAGNSGMVTINHEGKIFANAVFDREQYSEVKFRVIAVDRGIPPLSSTASVILTITDKNDNPPEFTKRFSFSVTENEPPHTSVGTVTTTDRDLTPNNIVFYSMAKTRGSENFEITRRGVIRTVKRLDREFQPEYQLDIIATDQGIPKMSTSTRIPIRIIDINDNAPEFSFPNKLNNTVYISYLQKEGVRITRIIAKDPDAGNNAKLTYSIRHGDTKGYFRMDNRTGVIILARPLTTDDAKVNKLTVEVKDNGHPPNSNVRTLNIVIDGTGKPIAINGAYIESPPSNKNLIIVICLATVSGVLAIILIVAIICIRQKDISNHNYNVKAETQRIFNNKPRPESCESSSDESKPPLPRKEVSFSLENDDPAADTQTSFLKNPIPWNSTTMNDKNYERRRTFNLSTNGTTENQSTYDNQRTAIKNKQFEMQLIEQLENNKLLKRICDSESETSTNPSSLADSGQGGSVDDCSSKHAAYMLSVAQPPLTTFKGECVSGTQVPWMSSSTIDIKNVKNRFTSSKFDKLEEASPNFDKENNKCLRTNLHSQTRAVPNKPTVDTYFNINRRYCENSLSQKNPGLEPSQSDGRATLDRVVTDSSSSSSKQGFVDAEKLCHDIQSLFFTDV